MMPLLLDFLPISPCRSTECPCNALLPFLGDVISATFFCPSAESSSPGGLSPSDHSHDRGMASHILFMTGAMITCSSSRSLLRRFFATVGCNDFSAEEKQFPPGPIQNNSVTEPRERELLLPNSDTFQFPWD